MKKLFYCICLMLLVTFIPSVNAEESVLIPFVGDSTTSEINSSSTFTIPSDLLNSGDGVKVTVLACNQSDAVSNNGVLTYSKDKCSDDNLTISWNSSDSTVASVTDGYIKYLKAGTTVITASSEGYTPVKITLTLTSQSGEESTSTGDDIPNLEDEESTVINKKVEKDNTESVPKTSYEGKQTTYNPKTGISDVLVYIVPILIIGGSIITLKRRCMN